MKRTDRLTTIIAVLLFLAMAAYVAAYALRSLGDALVTAQAVGADFDVGGVASGIVIRDETVLTSTERYIDVSVSDGTRVAAGARVATAMTSEEGLARAGRMRELELEISRLSAALKEMDSADDLTSRDAAVNASVSALASAVARHDLTGLDGVTLNLETLLFGVDSTDVSVEELEKLQRELASMQTSTDGDAKALAAPTSGTFSAAVDGYEHFSSADLKNLTPSAVEAMIDDGRESAEGAYGKLVGDYHWYFAAVMSAVDAANLAEGRTARLNFGRYYSTDIYARIQSISAPEDGQVAVVFRCDTAMADTLSMRAVSASVVFETYSGIRVPAEALRTDPETEATYVWCVTAMQLERKDVEIIYCDDDFVIVRRASDADALREGNTVVVSGKELYEGKVLE